MNRVVFYCSCSLLLFIVIHYLIGFDGLYGQDAYEYLRYTDAIKTFLVSGKPPGDYFWGVYYPIFGSFLSFIVPNTAFALQLLSAISLVITSIYIEKTIRLLYPNESVGWFPFLFFTLSPIVLIHSFLVMSDLLACCYTTVAIYFLLLFSKVVKTKTIVLGIAFTSLAILTRYASFVVLFPFGLWALITIIKHKKYSILVYAIFILAIIAIPHLWIRSQNSLQFLSHEWLNSWQITNLFQRNFSTVDGEMHNHFINLIYIFFSFAHPIFLVFGSARVITILLKSDFHLDRYQKLILTAIVIYALFIGGIPFQNKRFLLVSFPLVVVLLFPFIQNLILSVKYKKALFVSIGILQISLGLYFGKPFYDRNCLEKNVATQLKPYQNQTLYSFDIDIALQGRKLAFNYQSLFSKKYSQFEENALVLVNENQIWKQWKGKNPAVNLLNLKKNYRLILIKKYNPDWKLYQIQSRKI